MYFQEISSEKELSKMELNRLVIQTIIVVILLIVIAVVAVYCNPFLVAMLVRKVFDKPASIPPKELGIGGNTQMLENFSYGEGKRQVMDIYLPKEENGQCPVILWVHGGAFVGGDKRDVMYFAKALADEGYAVVAMNYTLAPEAKYPTPILQVGEVYAFLKSGEFAYKERLNMKNFFIAGDSAGAHIATQFALLQTNEKYRENFQEKARFKKAFELLPEDTFKGVLLYCGPYELGKIENITNKVLKFIMGQTGWAYFGEKNFTVGEMVSEIDIPRNITKAFPPTFITDGNIMSFPEHAKVLEEKLKQKAVPVKSLFFDKEEPVYHEFQFEMSKEESIEALEATITFLKQYQGL